jgi:hypothetical protein
MTIAADDPAGGLSWQVPGANCDRGKTNGGAAFEPSAKSNHQSLLTNHLPK